MSEKLVHVREYERSSGVVQSHERSLASGPNTRWLLPEGHNQPPGALLDVSRPDSAGHITIADLPGGGEEYATPVTRAQGQVIRLIPFTAIWAILSGAIVWLLGLTFPYLLLLFAGLTAVTYLVMNRDELRHSRHGVERHKVDSLTRIKLRELDHAHELRREALAAYLKHLESDK